mmetsp:Transcript_11159/g.29334  ORF Transcript_11159/g.29334 Transcript_11159/m.29334 type:complete len:882 (-) Transcript_11159:2844-5489(-)
MEAVKRVQKGRVGNLGRACLLFSFLLAFSSSTADGASLSSSSPSSSFVMPDHDVLSNVYSSLDHFMRRAGYRYAYEGDLYQPTFQPALSCWASKEAASDGLYQSLYTNTNWRNGEHRRFISNLDRLHVRCSNAADPIESPPTTAEFRRFLSKWRQEKTPALKSYRAWRGSYTSSKVSMVRWKRCFEEGRSADDTCLSSIGVPQSPTVFDFFCTQPCCATCISLVLEWAPPLSVDNRNEVWWDETEKEAATDAIVNYLLQQFNPSSGVFETVYSGLDTFFRLNSLHHTTDMQFRVAAVSASGDVTEFSPVTNVTTPASAPSSPLFLAVSSSQARSIQLVWSAPADSGGISLLGYVLEIRKMYQNGSVDEFASYQSITSMMTAVIVQSLHYTTQYDFRLIALNNIGSSPPSNIATGSTQIDFPAAPTHLHYTSKSASSITVAWDTPIHDGGSPVLEEIIEVRRVEVVPVPFSEDERRPYIASVRDYTIFGLAPSFAFEIRVRFVNAKGPSLPSTSITVTTEVVPPAQVEHAEIAVIGSRFVRFVAVIPAEFGSLPVLGFHVDLRDLDGNNTQSVALTLGETIGNDTYEVDSLHRNTHYQLVVSAVSGAGRGPPLPPLDFTTLSTVPSPPLLLNITSTSNTAATLSWSQPADNGGKPLTAYTIYAASPSPLFYASASSALPSSLLVSQLDVLHTLLSAIQQAEAGGEEEGPDVDDIFASISPTLFLPVWSGGESERSAVVSSLVANTNMTFFITASNDEGEGARSKLVWTVTPPSVPSALPPPTVGEVFFVDDTMRMPVYWDATDPLVAGGLPLIEYEVQIDEGFSADEYFPNRDQRGPFHTVGVTSEMYIELSEGHASYIIEVRHAKNQKGRHLASTPLLQFV